jgi:hypothetical protein
MSCSVGVCKGMARAAGEVVVVSGLPRSGTSMMMQLLAAGGVPLLADDHRPADRHNPRGYLEYEPVRRLREDSSWVAHAAGKAVKVVAPLLPYLPPGPRYRVLFMKRPLAEVVASQRRLLGEPEVDTGATSADTWTALFTRELERLEPLLRRLQVLDVPYHCVLGEPYVWAARVGSFVGRPLSVSAMAAVVDSSLYRVRLA